MTISQDRRALYPVMTDAEVAAIDAAYDAAVAELRDHDMRTLGDDRAENLVGAIARFVYDSRAEPPESDGPVAVTHDPTGTGGYVRPIMRTATVAAAERFIADRAEMDPDGVAAGNYGIDAPETPMSTAEVQILAAIQAAEARIENGAPINGAFTDLQSEFFQIVNGEVVYPDAE